MNAFKRVRRAVKPKSNIPAPVQPPPERPQRPTATPAEVKAPLRRFVAAASLDAPEAQEAQKAIKMIAAACGLYLTASTLNRYLIMMPSGTGGGVKYNKARGYEFTGELYFLHLQREIATMETRKRPLGPRVFKGYCDELFDSFFAGHNVRKGVGSSILIMESLLAKAISSEDHKSSFLELAGQAIESTVELTVRRHEKDVTDAKRASRLHKRGAAPEPVEKSTHAVIDQALVAYLNDLQARFNYLREGFSNISLRAHQSVGERPAASLQLEYLSGLLSVAEGSGYLGFTALLKEKAGAFLHAAQQEHAKDYILSAAHDYEVQADKERQLYLIRICTSRYHKARELFAFTNMPQRAAQIESKIAEVMNTHHSLFLTIPKF